MSSVMPFTFNNIALFTVKFDDKPWTRAKGVCKAPKYQRDTAHIIRDHVSSENYAKKRRLIKSSETDDFVDCPQDSRKDDYYTNEEGMYELLFSSQQPLAKAFRKYCCNTMFPQIRQKLTDKIQEEHQQAFAGIQEEHQLAIVEHEQAITLLNDDLQERDNQIQAIQYEKVGLRGKIRAKD